MSTQDISQRFPSAATGPKPTERMVFDSKQLHDRVIDLAVYIDTTVPQGRDKSLALTALEDVLMRANRAIYNPPSRTEINVSGGSTPTAAVIAEKVGWKLSNTDGI
jgi:hypothetical protein